MKGPKLRERVHELVTAAGRALHPREIAAKLDVKKSDFSKVTAAIDQLIDRRELEVLPGGRVRTRAARARGRFNEEPSQSSPKGPSRKRSEPETLEGTLTMHPRGFGFVATGGKEDVFVPPDAVFEALHGDKVKVEVVGKSPKGLEGRIAGVVSRRNPKVAGVLRKKGKSAWVEPDDGRLRGPLVLRGDHSVGRDGDAVIASIVRFPDFSGELPEAELAEVLGPPGELATEVRKILITGDVREQHAAETLENAEAMAERLSKPSLSGRTDLRRVPLPTIDPEDARDHDDAIWVERTRTGYRAYVAIADVSEYVRPGSALDAEAHERGCTIYLPDRAIPMLPRVLAADLCSLLPEVDRYCLCVIAELDRSGTTKSYEIVEGVMRSAARLTYGGVARTLGFDPESPSSPAAEAMKGDLEVLAELAEKLRKARFQRGALDLDLPEARVVVDPESGAPVEVHKRATRPGIKRAYSVVEEMMLLANELVARFLVERDVPAIFRVHGQPDQQKLEKLCLVAQKLGIQIESSQLLEPRGAADFLKRAQKHERHRVLEMLLLRSLKQAVYDTGNVGHFGLASEAYVHFTSPIRRYPDLRIHRQIKQLLRGERLARSDAATEELQIAATDSSKKERAAMDVERQVLDLYRAVYMQRHIGDTFDGTVTGLSGTGVFVAIDEPFCDVLIPYEALGLDQYELSEDEISVTARRSGETILLGDPLRVEVMDVAIGRRQVLGRRPREGRSTAEANATEASTSDEPWLAGGRPAPPPARRVGPARKDRVRPGDRKSSPRDKGSKPGRTSSSTSVGGRTSNRRRR